MFKLDTNAACAADQKSNYIEEAGKYTGVFTRAEYMQKQDTGSTGIGLTFKSDSGQEAQFYINLSYNHGQQNEGGIKLINALMACLKLREIPDPVQITVEKFDQQSGQKQKVLVQGFPLLMGKSIGLLLQMEIEKNSQKGIPRPVIYAPFDVTSEKTASEILRQLEPNLLAKMVLVVAAKPLIDRRHVAHQSSQPAQRNAQQQSGDPHFNDFEDEIPF